MAQMREMTSWQKHLANLKLELTKQEDKWEHREEEKEEIEKKRAEIQQIEEQMERERSEERRLNIEIVREDLQIKAEEEEKQAINLQNMNNAKSFVDFYEKQSPNPVGEEDSSPRPVTMAHEMERRQVNLQLIRNEGRPETHQNSIGDADHISAWSEDNGATQLTQHDAQNPQGEEEELNDGELHVILQNSQAMRRQAGGVLDPELSQLTKGGVAAVNRQMIQARSEIETNMHDLQADAESRALRKDQVLAQKTKKAKPAKLGPSTIRTLIRAAESRKD